MTGIVRKGDRLSSGGEVLSGASTCQFMRKSVARAGDPVFCPTHGNNRIAQATARARIYGKSIARHGDLCECGCYLISSLPGSGRR
ncbi:PAAR repeat-containing protein [Paraburkholderia hospita]|jgi:uncharacterized Zn-binding protein involved in type VI secretion|uniref:PAAR domain-containing protein n=3 Tax=Paraburkholderia hospita TaxID=169430 RepID=A0AAN1JF40_9BURK|nr:PAAR domain-containing protein [Paraburkholderia hospita]AUT72860.1 PAAR domain-containing protein [Paraburkholderia hospita]EIN02166.1 PAAR repeat-containing protein [Paraburkholderia hospita]OUL82713.1 hypothetical protein CA602_23690 [Paraburkholderia hospita]OUL82773.1 hypothetical protein CA601_28750 [Paraburkholderia hospita]